MRILVAGATGVLGRAVVPRLYGAGHEVLGVSRRDTSDRFLRDTGATPVRLDVFDADATTALAAGERIEAVLNLATHVPRGNAALRPGAWRTHDRLRRDASRALATAAIGAGARFVQESFAPAYPDRGPAWITEDVPLEPVAQTATVPDAEASAKQVTDAAGAGVALRFGLFYGPEASGELLAAARKGRLRLPGEPGGYVSLIHVDDAATAVVAALGVPPGVYNVVEDEPTTRAEHAAILTELLAVRRVRPMPRLLGRHPMLRALARSHRVSNARFREVASWQPAHPSPRTGWREVLEVLEVVDVPG
ncbi:NAD-dependent epimerase/dehydratase family protein [Egibacter rhizosphaerae]|uniref:NAD-dependent epimerase/dehydratase family protein n=1 Tax=Egibacter rhizosphaerae TaxID=1670831 RepID=A0A411YFH9_9ACTN|nr:NAD-dependent epimerase/dehydratase family protein [Egibacter rhizosphaerae]QBI19872.1 NAD-dependent epimerase/dehydratase family protein [Egibacter rhizosphaerae]